MNFRLCCTLAIAIVGAAGAELASWTPQASRGLTLAKGPDADITIKGDTAEIVPVSDYYRRAAFLLKADSTPTGIVWLTLTFPDHGYGLITASGAGEQWGVARLNSGKTRQAWFRIDKPAAEIQVRGLTQLSAATLTDVEPPRQPLPDVRPAFTVSPTMDLVISAGADANNLDGLQGALASMRNQVPLAKALGFNGIESYVKWNFIERKPGVFDWSFYDAIVDELERNDMRWFPLIVIGSAYSLPEWFYQSPEMTGYRCLEHGVKVEIPTIFNDNQNKYVQRFLAEFGKHYAKRKGLLGIRLGPSGNYGEAQYPATGALGYKGGGLHTHLGYWAGDPDASIVFRRRMKEKYGDIAALNKAWDSEFGSFDEVHTFHPLTANTPRMRLDFNNWYMAEMSEWCAKWAAWAREAMPEVSIYQSSGGWGAVEIGTDYAAHTKAMAPLKGGVRLTNENDSFLNNVGVTKLVASAARYYGVKLGSEPAGYSSVRGVMGRLYNALTNQSSHLFYYSSNLFDNDQAIGRWLEHAPLLNQRAQPVNEIAVFYPDTDIRVSDDTLRHLRGSALFQRIQPLRSVTDYDLVSEQMVLDGALDRFKVLVIVWARMSEAPVLEAIQKWVEKGGVVIYPDRLHSREGGLATPEGDKTIYTRWQKGDTGRGRVLLYPGHPEPVHYFIDYLRDQLRSLDVLSPATRAAIAMDKPQETYWSILANGSIAIMNYDDAEAAVRLPGREGLTRIAPYSMVLAPAAKP